MIRNTFIAFLSVTVTSAFADTIELKSGETIEGTVTSETQDSVTIEVPFSASIIDTRVIAKTDIEAMDRQTKDQKAYVALTALEVPKTILDSSGLEKIRLEIEAFIATHPNSAHLADARGLLAQIKALEARLAAGEVKIDDEWISAERYVAEKYQIEARAVADAIARATSDGNPVAALNLFGEMKKSYPHAIAFADAVAAAKTAAAELDRRLTFELANLETKLAERARSIELTAQADRERVRAAMEAEDARLKRVAEQATAAGRKFFPISSIDANGLKLMKTAVTEVKKDLLLPESASIEAKVVAAKDAIKAVAESDLETAKAALANLESKWPQFEGLARLKAQISTNATTSTSVPAEAPKTANSPAAPTPSPSPAPAGGTIGL